MVWSVLEVISRSKLSRSKMYEDHQHVSSILINTHQYFTYPQPLGPVGTFRQLVFRHGLVHHGTFRPSRVDVVHDVVVLALVDQGPMSVHLSKLLPTRNVPMRALIFCDMLVLVETVLVFVRI